MNQFRLFAIASRWILIVTLAGQTNHPLRAQTASSVAANVTANVVANEVTAAELAAAAAIENQRIATIDQVIGSVVAVYGPDRQGGGSGVIIDPSGIALTNHHVIVGAGIKGFGGLDDGQLYPWTLIGTDPGGDVAVIQLTGRDRFPCSPLGNSDTVEAGDWALAMGNPFLLATDQTPTVTLGIVSGVKRYQPGAGANQLVYGNCIQVDSSINPGNSGGPLFNLAGEVIGINGRGSFQDRGRVNVGLGYAISANQIKNFLPDLLATKLTEHATLDASFADRNGIVVCSQIDRMAPITKLGLSLGDELLEFEGTVIHSANQFTNLICTLPEDWPAAITIRKLDGDPQTLRVRTFGLPYPKQPRQKPLPRPDAPLPEDDEAPEEPDDQEPPTPAQKEQAKALKQQMIALLAVPPGTVRAPAINRRYAEQLLGRWSEETFIPTPAEAKTLRIESDLLKPSVKEERNAFQKIGTQTLWLAQDGRFRVLWSQSSDTSEFWFDGKDFSRTVGGQQQTLSRQQAYEELPLLQGLALTSLIAAESPPQNGNSNAGLFSLDSHWLIDGGGKSHDLLAWRYRLHHPLHGADSLFSWFDIQSEREGLSSQLRKIAPDRDSDSGAVRFVNWKPFGQGSLPYVITFVESLAETELLRIEAIDIRWTDAPALKFDEPGVTDE